VARLNNESKIGITFLAGTLGCGGAERQLYYILKTLKGEGHDVRLLCLKRGEFWEKEIRELDIPIIWVGQHESRLRRLLRIISELKTQRPDIVQSQHFYTNLYAFVAARVLGIKEIGAVRGDLRGDVGAGNFILGQLSLRLPRMIAANSRAAIQEGVSLGVASSRLFFLPNVVDSELFKSISRDRNRSVVKLLAVGSLTKQKRLDRFLSIVKRLQSKEQYRFEAAIVGDGACRSELENKAHQLGLFPPTLVFKGNVADVNYIYQDADILLLTSDSEGTPNVILEAMAAQLPVVSTNV
jgi:glycosyltransferase involved in cell wall biosynthesis